MKSAASKIPYGRQWVGHAEIMAVESVLRSNYLTQGPKVSEFESSLAKQVGSRYAVAVSNGTAALHLAALALNLKPGDEVITSPISFLATSNAILYANAKVVFADIDPTTQCISQEAIQKKISRKTRAIFLTDFAGHPADLKAIRSLARQHDLKVIEDAAHSLGSVYRGSPIGSCQYSDLTIFSFHPVKHITTGEGGAVTTNQKELYQKILALRSHGVTRDPDQLIDRNQGGWYYEMQSLGFNYRMTDIQAALGVEQLKNLDRFIAKRREIAARYKKAFKNLPQIELPEEKKDSKHVYHLFVVRLKPPYRSYRKKIFEELHRKGIGVQVHYIPIPAQPYYQNLGYSMNYYPKAQAYYDSALSLPIFPKMTDREVDYVIETVSSVLRQYLSFNPRR